MSAKGKILFNDWDWIQSLPTTEEPVCLTWQERHMILSIIDQVGWLTRWTGNADKDTIEGYRDALVYKLTEVCAVDCSEVIACVQGGLGEGTDLTLALQAWLSTNINQTPPYPEGLEDVIALTGENLNIEGCNDDEVFGFTLQLTQSFNRWSENYFEIVEVGLNAVELAEIVADSVPILTTVFDLINWFQENMHENYVANYDQELENKIACDLKCIAMSNPSCTLSWDDLLKYFSYELYYSLQDVTLADWASFVIEGFWDGDEFVYIMFMTIAAVMGLGGDWFGITLEGIQRIIASYFNDPSNDWTTLCDTCDTTYGIYYLFDYEDPKGWTIIRGDFSVPDSGYLYSLGSPEPLGHHISIEREFVAFDGLELLQFPNLVINTVNTFDLAVTFWVTHNGTREEFNVFYSPGSVGQAFDPPLNRVTKIEMLAREDYAGDGGVVRINGVYLGGDSFYQPPQPE